jgi:hypothetical protein
VFQRESRYRNARLKAGRDKTLLRSRLVTPATVPANKPDPQFLIFVAHHKLSTRLVHTLCITALKGKRCGEIRAYPLGVRMPRSTSVGISEATSAEAKAMKPRRILLGLDLALVGLSEQGEIEGSIDSEECLNLALKRHDRGNDGNSARKALTKNSLVVLEPRTLGLSSFLAVNTRRSGQKISCFYCGTQMSSMTFLLSEYL